MPPGRQSRPPASQPSLRGALRWKSRQRRYGVILADALLVVVALEGSHIPPGKQNFDEKRVAAGGRLSRPGGQSRDLPCRDKKEGSRRGTMGSPALDRLLDEPLPLTGLRGGNVYPLAHLATHAGIEEICAGKCESAGACRLVDELHGDAAVLPEAGDDLAVLTFQAGHAEHLPRRHVGVPRGDSVDQLVPGHGWSL